MEKRHAFLLGALFGILATTLAVRIEANRDHATIRDLSDSLDACRVNVREASCCCDLSCIEQLASATE